MESVCTDTIVAAWKALLGTDYSLFAILAILILVNIGVTVYALGALGNQEGREG